jgi:hypothetical protein
MTYQMRRLKDHQTDLIGYHVSLGKSEDGAERQEINQDDCGNNDADFFPETEIFHL